MLMGVSFAIKLHVHVCFIAFAVQIYKNFMTFPNIFLQHCCIYYIQPILFQFKNEMFTPGKTITFDNCQIITN
jgi:hypothetical protein